MDVMHFPFELEDEQSSATLYAALPNTTDPSVRAGRSTGVQASELPHPTVHAVCGPEHPVKLVDPLPTGLQERPSKHAWADAHTTKVEAERIVTRVM